MPLRVTYQMASSNSRRRYFGGRPMLAFGKRGSSSLSNQILEIGLYALDVEFSRRGTQPCAPTFPELRKS